MQFLFEDHVLDIDRRELRRGAHQVPVGPQVFDLLVYLLQNRERVVTKDDLLDSVWSGRFVSESNLTTRINAARKAIGDSGEEQRLIRTVSRKGFRFVGAVRTAAENATTEVPAGTATTRIPLPLPDKPSIAVLPFDNISGDREQEYFADGMVEEIITALSRFRQLFVIARNSTFTYKGEAVDVKQVGRELGVRYVLEGSVRKSNDQVRIAAQLIDATTAAHLWADRFDRPIENIFDLQDRLTASVVGALVPQLQQAEIDRAKRKPTDSLDAYDYFLRATARFHHWTKEATGEALGLCYKAILDGAHMLAGQPLAATMGFGTQAHVVASFSMDLNGNGITVSNEVWGMMKPGLRIGPDGRPEHPIKANSLKPVIEKFRVEGRPFKMGMVSPVSTHNYELRYWLAAGGLHPGYYDGPSDVSGQIAADVLLSVIPPPQMPASLEAGTINGYCVGAPWNQQAVFKGVGVPVITDYEIWKNNPEKVFGLRADFIEQYPNTALGLTKALIRAAIWLDADGNANRGEAATILARPEYVGVDAEVIARSMTGTFEYEKGDRRAVPDFNVFFRYFATYPYYSDAVWYLTQMRRWGQISEDKPDAWYVETAAKVYRPDLYLRAARLLVKKWKAQAADFPWDSDGYHAQAEFFDGTVFDGHRPNAYLAQFAIGLKSGERIENGRPITSRP